MPWQECYKMDERLRFVARLLDGEKMAALCREFVVAGAHVRFIKGQLVIPASRPAPRITRPAVPK